MDSLATLADALRWVLDHLEARKDAIQTGAILLGAVWGYFRFVRGRTFATRAKIANDLVAAQVGNRWRQLRLSVEVANSGNGMIRLILVQCQARQVAPLTPEVTAASDHWLQHHELSHNERRVPAGVYAEIGRGAAPPSYYDELVDWPVIDSQVVHLRDDVSVLEPGESDHWALDLAVPADVECVHIHTLVWLDSWRFWKLVQGIRQRIEGSSNRVLETLAVWLLPVYWEARTVAELRRGHVIPTAVQSSQRGET